MIIAGILLIIGGAVAAGITIRNNLPSPFDIASASGENGDFLPIIAPAGLGNGAGSATQAGAPTVNPGGNYAPAATPESRPVGMIPERLVIPSINIDAPILPVSYKEIRVDDKVYYQWLAPQEYAAGWQDSSTMLGLPGNTVLNGHHNEYGRVFKDLVTLDIGDEVSIYSGSQEFRYQVVAKLLLPERWAPLEKRFENARWIERSTDERITLITCWPADSNTHRVIIVAMPIGSVDNNPTPTPTSQFPTITICINDTTMIINPSDLSQYPNYKEGACSLQTSTLTIEMSVNEHSYTLVGDVLHYSYLIKNTGEVSMNDIAVIDDKTFVACPKTTLKPGESMTCKAIYTVKNADHAAESIINTAYAAAKPGNTPVESYPDSQTVIRFLRLNLSSRCAVEPGAWDGWQVENDNSYKVSFEYALDGGASGTGAAPANSTVTFNTPVDGRGTGVMTLYVGGFSQNNASVKKGCK